MIRKIKQLLEGNSENHLMPFFWQHGEDEETLREYMKVIDESGCRAVCVESRPHPDFCGEKWWTDMDIILDEARKRGMKVWILDDSHFPTGYANGAVKNAPLEQHRQSICAGRLDFAGDAEEEKTVEIDVHGSFPPEFHPNMIESYILAYHLKDAPHFEDDRILSVTAVNHRTGEEVVLDIPAQGEKLSWRKPKGEWTVWITGLSRNFGPHREYINMMDPASCRLLIDAVYEPHWAHYKEDFGKTIAGFFSDEPELGNGHIFTDENQLGTDQDLPFAGTLPEKLAEKLGENWAQKMYLLWDNEADADERAHVRYAYMDVVTKQVREAFSRQIGEWCRAHGVQYIGHVIEDGNAHGRTATSLGHYFRGLDGQDMSGIDDIGGQVFPQGEEEPKTGVMGKPRDGEFYHYMLGALGASAAAVEPGKKGNAMCEIFGNYGWAEGVQLEKYLADHFMVRGINNFVPHAFDPAPFPDPDCPPHFYAHGHNPQYRHFGALMRYMNRVSTLISGGRRAVSVAVLYHAEAEWAGESMLTQKPARRLCEAQIGFDCIPADVFAEPERYGTVIGSTLRVNTQEYQALVIPYAEYVTKALAETAARLCKEGCPVIFVDGLPKGICDLDANEECPGETRGMDAGEEHLDRINDIGAREKCPDGIQGLDAGEKSLGGIRDLDTGEKYSGGISDFAVGGKHPEEICGCNRGQEQLALTELLAECQVVSLEELVPALNGLGLPEIRFEPGNTYLRALHYQEACGLYYFVNEGAQTYRGTVTVPDRGCCYVYDAWENACRTIEAKECPEGTRMSVVLEPRKSLIVLFDAAEDTDLRKAVTCEGEGVELTHCKRSVCEAVEYPSFREEKEVMLPDCLAQENPDFSGFVRYESRFTVKYIEAALKQPGQEGLCTERLDTECPVVELPVTGCLFLELTDACEGVELFINGKSAGIQIVAPYRYDLTEYIQEGENSLVIEVATTLERKCYDMTKDDPRMKMRGLAEPVCGSGITGRVVLNALT